MHLFSHLTKLQGRLFAAAVLGIFALSPTLARATPITDVSAAELATYEPIYQLPIPATYNFNTGGVPYSLDHSATVLPGSFTRVAYYLELQAGANPRQWVWVSFITPSTDPKMLGVPNSGTNIVYNGTVVNNLHIESNSPLITQGNFPLGDIEFWASNYSQGGGGGLGSSDANFDWKDSGGTTGGGHGSMQVFNYPLKQCLFGFNGLNQSGHMGIGNQNPWPGDIDWTFGPNASAYSVRNLEVWVNSVPPATMTWDSTTNNWDTAHWTGPNPPPPPTWPDLTLQAAVPGGKVSVVNSQSAYSLTVTGGEVALAPGASLTLDRKVTVDPGAMLTLGAGSTLSTQGGTVNSLRTSGGTSTLRPSGALTVTNFTDQGIASTLVQQGAGTLALQNVTAGAGTTFNAAAGTLAVQYPTYLGSASGLTLSGGTFTITGQATYQPGLRELSITGNAFDEATANTSLTFQLSPRMGETNVKPPWLDNNTWVYTGQVYDADGLFSFAENIDDNVSVRIDGVLRLRNTNYSRITNTSTTGGLSGSTAYTNENTYGGTVNFGMGPNGDGWHTIEIRFGNGGGGAGAVADATNHWTASYGFGFSATGATSYDGNDYVIPTDPGNATLFRVPVTGAINMATPITVAAGTTGSVLQANSDLGATFGTLTLGKASDLSLAGTSMSFTKILTNGGNSSLGLSTNVTTPGFDDQGLRGTLRLYGTKSLTIQGDTISPPSVVARSMAFQIDSSATLSLTGRTLLGGAAADPLVVLNGGTFSVTPSTLNPSYPNAYMAGTNVNVSASSTVTMNGTGTLALGVLRFTNPCTLTTTGSGPVDFLTTTLDAAGTTTFNVQTRTLAGNLNAQGLPATLAVKGTSSLIFQHPPAGLQNTTFLAQSGSLGFVGSDRTGGRPIQLAGGTAVLGSVDGSNQTYGNTITGGGSLVAGASGIGVASGDIVVPNLTPAAGSTIDLSTQGSHRMVLPNGVTSSGNLSVSAGQIAVPSPLSVGSLTLTGGTTTLTSGATVTRSLMGGGTLVTQGNMTIDPQQALGLSGALNVTSGHLTLNVPASGTPTSLSGLQAWYSASTIASVNGATVGSWADLSGNGHTATYNTGGVTFATNQINGLPAVQFRAGSLNVSANLQAKEEYIVLKTGNGGTTFGPDWGSPFGRQDGNGWMFQGGTTQFWTDVNHVPQAVSENGTVVPSSPYALSGVNNYMVLKVDLSTNDGAAAAAYYLGRNGGWNNSNLDVAEVLAFNRTLTPAEEQNLGGYLGSKYGITTTYSGSLTASVGDVRLGPAAQLTLNGSNQATMNSVGVTGGPTVTGPLTVNSGSPRDFSANAKADTLTINAPPITAANFKVTGPGTVTLKQNVTVNSGGTFSVSSNASLATQGNVTVGSSAALSVAKGSALSVTGGSLVTPLTIDSALAASVYIKGDLNLTANSVVQVNVPAAVSMPAGLVARYDASTLALANGAAVTSWTDSSGNGHTAGTPGGTVTFATNQINGLPAVRFHNGSLTIANTMADAQEYIVFKSGYGTTFGPDWDTVVGRTDNHAWMLQGGTTQFWGDGNSIPQAVSENGTVIPANPFPLTNVNNYMVLKIDTNAATSVAGSYYLGKNQNWGNGYLDVAEVLLFSSKLSAADQNSLGGYLAIKYGIATSYTGNLGAPNLGNLNLASGTTLILGDAAKVAGAGAAAFDSITAASGATIQGAVTLNGPVTVGSSPGTLNVTGSFAMGAGSSYTWETEGSGVGQSDLIAVSGAPGNLDLTGPWTLNITPLKAVSTGIYDLFTYTGALTGSGATLARGTSAYSDLINMAGTSITTSAGKVSLSLAMTNSAQWTGAGSPNTAWTTSANWNGGLPSPSNAAIVNSGVSVATLTSAMGTQQANTLIIDTGGAVLIDSGAALQVTDGTVNRNAWVQPTGQLTVRGTLTAAQLNTAGTTTFGPYATLNVPAINVTGGTTSGSPGISPGDTGTALGAGTTLTLNGGTLAGPFTSQNTSTTPGSYAFEIQSGTTAYNAVLQGAGASLHVPSTAGTSTIGGPVYLNTMSVEGGTTTIADNDTLKLNTLTVSGGSLNLNRPAQIGTVNVGATMTMTRGMTVTQSLLGSGTIIADGSQVIDASAAGVAFGGTLRVTSSKPANSGDLMVKVGSTPPPPPAGQLDNPGIPAAEKAGMQLVYEIAAIPTNGNWGTSSYYSINNAASIANGSFTRVAYYMELTPNAGSQQWLFTSFDAAGFTNNASKIGVPNTASGELYHYPTTAISNMSVYSNVASIVTGTGIQTGNIEFWPTNYGGANAYNVPGANGGTFDFGDQDTPGGYGSMQIHNYGAAQTLFAYNNWNSGNNADLGIGSQPTGNPDWTFANNVASYSQRLLRIFVSTGGIPSLGNVQLDPGSKFTLGGAGVAAFTSVGATGGVTVTGPFTAAPTGAAPIPNFRSDNAQSLTLNAGLMATNFKITGPGTVALTQDLTMASGGQLSVSSNATLTAQNSLTIDAASASLYMKGNLNVASGTLTVNMPPTGASSMPSGLVARYDASSLTLANGAAVTTWTDLSGNGHTATTPGGTVTYATNQIGGLPAVQFHNGSLTIAGTMSVAQEYIVLRSGFGATFGPDWDTVLGRTDNHAWMLQGGTTQFWTDGNALPQAVSENGAVIPSSPYAMSNVNNYMVLKIDTNAAESVAGSYYLGKNQGWGNGYLDVAEVLVFGSKLSPTDQNNLGGYLAGKYGISTAYTGYIGARSLGNLQMAPGTQLILGGGGAAAFDSIVSGDQAKITGNAVANGLLDPTGKLTVTGDLHVGDGVLYKYDLSPNTKDLVEANQVFIDGDFVLSLAGAGLSVSPTDMLELFRFDAQGGLLVNVDGSMVPYVDPVSTPIQAMIQCSTEDPFNTYAWDTSNAEFVVEGQSLYLTGILAAAVPEPATLTLLGLGALALLRRRRARKA